LNKNTTSNYGKIIDRSPSKNFIYRNIEEDAYNKKNIRNNSSSKSIDKSGNQNNNEFGRKNKNENQHYHDNQEDNIFENKRNNIPNSNSNRGNRFSESNF